MTSNSLKNEILSRVTSPEHLGKKIQTNIYLGHDSNNSDRFIDRFLTPLRSKSCSSTQPQRATAEYIEKCCFYVKSMICAWERTLKIFPTHLDAKLVNAEDDLIRLIHIFHVRPKPVSHSLLSSTITCSARPYATFRTHAQCREGQGLKVRDALQSCSTRSQPSCLGGYMCNIRAIVPKRSLRVRMSLSGRFKHTEFISPSTEIAGRSEPRTTLLSRARKSRCNRRGTHSHHLQLPGTAGGAQQGNGMAEGAIRKVG